MLYPVHKWNVNSDHLIQSNPYVAVLLQIQAFEGSMMHTRKYRFQRLIVRFQSSRRKPIIPKATLETWRVSMPEPWYHFSKTAYHVPLGASVWYIFGSKFGTSVPGLVLSVSWPSDLSMKLGKLRLYQHVQQTDRPTTRVFLGRKKKFQALWL